MVIQPSKINFRPATSADEQFARQAEKSAYYEVVVKQYGSWDDQLNEIHWRKLWIPANFKIIEADGQPVGYFIVENNPDHIFLKELVVIPEFQNRKTGSEVVSRIICDAAESGRNVKLLLLKSNRVVELYKRLGFRITGEDSDHFYMEHARFKSDNVHTPNRDNLHIRLAVPEDADSLKTIYLTSRREFVSYAPLVHTEVEILKWIKEELIGKDKTYIAFYDKSPIGMMSLSSDDRFGWIDNLYLLPGFLNLKIGSDFIQIAKSNLKTPVRLYTFQQNENARRFYAKHGFKEIESGDGSGNEEGVPDVLMEWNK